MLYKVHVLLGVLALRFQAFSKKFYEKKKKENFFHIPLQVFLINELKVQNFINQKSFQLIISERESPFFSFDNVMKFFLLFLLSLRPFFCRNIFSFLELDLEKKNSHESLNNKRVKMKRNEKRLFFHFFWLEHSMFRPIIL